MTALPTRRQLTLLAVAHRNGGRLPSNSFARSGAYPVLRGAETIHAALTAAAQTPTRAAAALLLVTSLDDGQLRMAGGFLHLDIDRSRFAPADLADLYVTAIRAGYVTHADERITLLTLRACIAHGWLDEVWNLTPAGLAAGRAAGWPDFAPLYDLTWQDHVNERAAEISPGRPDLAAAVNELLAEDEVAAYAEAAEREPAPVGTVWMQAGDGPVTLGRSWWPGEQDLGKLRSFGDWSDSPVGGTSGCGKSNIVPEILDVQQATVSAVHRGVPAAVAGRLAPAVRGDLADQLADRVVSVAYEIAGLVGGELGQRLTGDFRAVGYRITVFEARKDAEAEAVRRAALQLESALTAMVHGYAERASNALNRACEILGIAVVR